MRVTETGGKGQSRNDAMRRGAVAGGTCWKSRSELVDGVADLDHGGGVLEGVRSELGLVLEGESRE